MTKEELKQQIDLLEFATLTKFSFMIMRLASVVTNILTHLISLEDRIEKLNKAGLAASEVI